MDSEISKSKQWTKFYEMWALSVITGCVAASQGRLPTYLFLVSQAVVVCTCISVMIVIYRGKNMFKAGVRWKQPAKVAIYCVAGTTALFNATLVGLGAELTSKDSLRLILSMIPLGLSLIVFLTLLLAWWRSLPDNITWRKRGGGNPPLHPLTPPSGVVGHTEVQENPMFHKERRIAEDSARRRKEQEEAKIKAEQEEAARIATLNLTAPWSREQDVKTGVWFWYNPATGESKWEVPAGGFTSCGWSYEKKNENGDGGAEVGRWGDIWVHKIGAQRFSPPPANKERNEAILEAYKKREALRGSQKNVRPPPQTPPKAIDDEKGDEEEDYGVEVDAAEVEVKKEDEAFVKGELDVEVGKIAQVVENCENSHVETHKEAEVYVKKEGGKIAQVVENCENSHVEAHKEAEVYVKKEDGKIAHVENCENSHVEALKEAEIGGEAKVEMWEVALIKDEGRDAVQGEAEVEDIRDYPVVSAHGDQRPLPSGRGLDGVYKLTSLKKFSKVGRSGEAARYGMGGGAEKRVSPSFGERGVSPAVFSSAFE